MWWAVICVFFSIFFQDVALDEEYDRKPVDLFDFDVRVPAGFNLKPDYYIKMQEPNEGMPLNSTMQDYTNVLEPTTYITIEADRDIITPTEIAQFYSDYDSSSTGRNSNKELYNVTFVDYKNTNDDNETYIEEKETSLDNITYIDDNNINNRKKMHKETDEDTSGITDISSNTISNSVFPDSDETVSNSNYTDLETELTSPENSDYLDSTSTSQFTITDNESDDGNYVTDSTRKTIDFRTAKRNYFTKTTPYYELYDEETTSETDVLKKGRKFNWDSGAFVTESDAPSDSVTTYIELSPTHSKSRNDLVPTITKPKPTLSIPRNDFMPTITKQKPTKSKSRNDLAPAITKPKPTLSKPRNDLVPTITKKKPTKSKPRNDIAPTITKPTLSKPRNDLVPTITKLKPTVTKSRNDLVPTRSKPKPTLSKPRNDLVPTVTKPQPTLSKFRNDLVPTLTKLQPTLSKSRHVLVPTVTKPQPTLSKFRKVFVPTVTESQPTRSKFNVKFKSKRPTITKAQPTRSKPRKVFLLKITKSQPTRSKSIKVLVPTITKSDRTHLILSDARGHSEPTRKKLQPSTQRSKFRKVLAPPVTKSHPTRSKSRENLVSFTMAHSVLHSKVIEAFATMYPMYPEDTTTTTVEIGTEEFNTDDSTITIPAPVNIFKAGETNIHLITLMETSDDTAIARTGKEEEKNIDVDALINMLGGMINNSADRLNIIDKFNQSLQNFSIPTCVPMPTTEPTTEGSSTIDFTNTTLVAKCYVCGLEVEGIPYNAHCADAFASDFIPLAAVNAKAKAMLSKYRKYCHYIDVNRVIYRESEPHSVFGRFTGGCSVRWVDLTGVYTQRSCRNKRRAVLGKHFASKRMAKLEMALSDVSDGCIISPMASLLPVSRAISLYARFHACVCTGYWCNKAVPTQQWMMSNAMILVLVTCFS